MKFIKTLILIFMIPALFSCAVFRPGVRSNDALELIEKLNAGDVDFLIDATDLPIVFDGEILESDSQIRALWSGLVQSGYTVDDPEIAEQRPVLISDSALFSESWETGIFFKNVLKDEDVLVLAEGASQRITMVLRSGKKGRTVIKAWKGEMK